jgi:LuxR family transcriptional regulator, maltose regulon positive regulatory protein
MGVIERHQPADPAPTAALAPRPRATIRTMGALDRTSVVRPPSLVARPALFERLSAGLDAGVTLLSAPAGSGKTVLLRSWIEAEGLGERAAWVSVERDERNPQHFWRSAVDALSGTHLDGSLENVVAAPQFDGAVAIERLVAALGSLDESVLLVIDDLHELRSPEALTQLETLLDRRPQQLAVMLSTRHDPAIGLHRYRLSGELTELRASDLRFQRDDARQLLSAAGIDLPATALDALVARTEGWAAGLRLAALSLAGRADAERFVAEFSGSERTVADYLMAEVLQRQPEPVRGLLLRTSILERVNGPLADRLVGAPGSERILLELEDAGAFVVSIDPDRVWFRYHQMFADLLRLELRRSEPDSIPNLHRAAAEWFEAHDFPTEAIRHAQAAGDWQYAGELIGQYGFSLALDGGFATMRALLEPFPADAFANPELAAFLAYGEVIRPSLDTAASYIALAERHASEVPEERRQRFDAMLATARLTLARWRGDYAAAVSEVPPLLAPSEALRAGDIRLGNDLRAVALMSLGIVELWAGAGDDAEQHLREGAELARRVGRPYVEQGCLAHLALAVGRHSITAGRALAAEALEIIDKYGWQSEPITPLVLATIGLVDAMQGRLAEAAPNLDRALELLRPDAEPAKEILVRYARGVHLLGQARLADASAAFADTLRLQASLIDPDPLEIAARALEAQTLARLGDLEGARAALATGPREESEYAETRVATAAIHLAEQNATAATAALGPVLADSSPAIIHDFALIQARLLDALARDALGDARAAEDDLERALDLAEREGLIVLFLITPVRDLLERHPRHRTAHAALLDAILDVQAGAAPQPRDRDDAGPIEELTESEIRVLRYLPSNLSAPEIASEVFLSTSTVKTHMRHIYEKLGVHKRTEAVERARDLGLLAPAHRSRH